MPPAPDESTVPEQLGDGEVGPTGQWGRYVVVGQLGAGGMGIVFVAQDPALGRKVAIKLLRPPRDRATAAGAERIELEAKAMARLAHPNVVTVFEVDRVADQMYVAMELVEGTTLRGWLRESPRRWREIVAMLVAAGRGLAAAHAAGLVHRDFKPDNVLIGHDGRPRVSDFGLVIETGAVVTLAEPRDAPPEVDITARGTVAGTPAYMSAEQWAGGPVDARSDQFAFCVTLWEALWGRRPFSGSTRASLRVAVDDGAIDEPSRARAPRWLSAVLRRGLATDPTVRWPDMDTLLDELERGTRTGRRWTIAVASAGAAILAALVATTVGARDAPDACAPPAARIAAVWNPARRDALSVHLTAVDPVEGARRFASIASALDIGARGWSDMHVHACRATHEGRQSDTLLDRRMACLDRWLGELGDTIGVIEQTGTRSAVDQAVHAAIGLSPLEACADVRALTEALPLPAEATARATAIALAHQIEALEVARRARQLEGLTLQSRGVVDAARALGHAPTLATALALRARVVTAIGDAAAGEAVLRELAQVAALARDDRVEAFAWMNLFWTISEGGKRDEALTLVPSASAAVLRAGNPADLRADLLYLQASVLSDGPRHAEALSLLEQARLVLEQAGASSVRSPLAARLGDVLFSAGISYQTAGDNDRAVASYEQAIDRWRALYGVDSPDEAFGWNNLGSALRAAGKLDQALAASEQSVRIREARLGESPALAGSLVGVALVFEEQHRWADAVAVYDRALRIDRAVLAPGDLHLGTPLVGRAMALGHLGRLDDAAHAYDEIVELYDKAGARTISLTVALYERGELAAQHGHCGDTIRDDLRAVALLETLVDPRSHRLIYPLVGAGVCLVRAGRSSAAIAPIERALGLNADAGDELEIARGRAYLGRALVDTGRDARRGFALIHSARPALAKAPEGAHVLRELDRWLATRARP